MSHKTDVKAIFISDIVAADDNGYSVSAAVANNAALVIGGALADSGAVTNSSGRLTEITSGSDDSAISFTVVGTDVNGASMTESITGVGDPAGTVIAGTTAAAADVIFSGRTRVRGLHIINDAAAGTVDIVNTDDASAIGSGTSTFKVGTVAAATVVSDVSIPEDGVLFEDGAYAVFAIGKCESLTVFRD